MVIAKEILILSRAFILSFTEKGESLAVQVADFIRKSDIMAEVTVSRVENLTKYMNSIFADAALLVFVGAAGIAVRAIAPHIKSKVSDPAVIVIDEAAQFVVPLLSGHIGGANRYARDIAEMLGALPIVTTSTDVNGVFSIDAYAVENGYTIVNPETIKHISAAMLAKNKVGIHSDFEIGELCEGLEAITYSEGSANDSAVNNAKRPKTGVCISLNESKKPFDVTLNLIPKCFHIGVGARKNADAILLEKLFLESIDALAIPVGAVAAISSVDLKRNENAILKLSEKYGIRYITYSVDELEAVAHNFAESAFVKATVGTGSVCEASAYLSSKGGDIVLTKKAKDGFTIAIARESWRVSFGNNNGGARS